MASGQTRHLDRQGTRLSIVNLRRPYQLHTISLHHRLCHAQKRPHLRQRILGTRVSAALALPPSVATVASTAVSLASYIRGSIDPTVLSATATASYQLFLVCAAVGWLLKTKKIPDATAGVSFQLLIPCMLFSKVAATLAASPDNTIFLAMATASVSQVVIGALWGRLLAPLVDASGLKDFSLFGTQPFSPGGRPAAAIAQATAAATGLPQAAAALLPRPSPPPPGLRELITAACAFGNSFTLPVVFLSSLLPGVFADQAIGYAGLFLLAWSPCLWTFGLMSVENGFLKARNTANASTSFQQQQGQISPMFVLSGGGAGSAIEIPSTSSSSSSFSSSISSIDEDSNKSSFLPKFKFKFDPAAFNRSFSRTMNPPVLAILIGMITGLSPAGKALFEALKRIPGAASGAPAALPLELSLAWYGLKGAFEVIEMLAAGTLAMQTLVLASSLLQTPPPNSTPSSAETPLGSSSAQQQESEARPGGMLKAIFTALAPSDATEARALAVLSVVRFLCVPITSILLWKWVSSTFTSRLAALTADPLFLFVIAVQAVMPSAQNLIIMLQLSDITRPAAPAFARLLLKLYAYAVLPVTLWVTAFASRLQIPLI